MRLCPYLGQIRTRKFVPLVNPVTVAVVAVDPVSAIFVLHVSYRGPGAVSSR